MKLLFFDCETTGKPKNYNASYEDVDNWPRVISLAWILADIDAKVLQEQHHLVKPNGWTMPTEQFWIDNGFSQEKSMELGIPIEEVLLAFFDAKEQADALVAHNLNFDHRIVWAEFIRAGMKPRSGMHKICTMQKSTLHCKLPQTNGRGGYKWPTLTELHWVLFNSGFEGAHDALADVKACKDCLFELLKQGVIVLPAGEPAP